MSLHVKISPEAEAALYRQRRNSSIASLLIGILLVSVLALIFYFIGITLFVKETEPFVAYTDDTQVTEELEQVKVVTQVVKRKPSSSSSATSPVIASTNPNASFSVPEVEVEVETLSATFGVSDGFGKGFGTGFAGFGSSAGSGFSFFGQPGGGGNVAFVIDYSKSMEKGNKIGLLKGELKKTIESLPNGMKYQLIYFAGPTWLGGVKVLRGNGSKKAGGTTVLEFDNSTYTWKVGSGVDKDVEPDWITSSAATRKKTAEQVVETGMLFGTTWLYPLKTALRLDPKPDTIVFLTDGLSGDDVAASREIAELAQEDGVVINTISLLEPAARESLSYLAEKTGGDFSLINGQGEKVGADEKANTSGKGGKSVKKHEGYNK